MVTVTVTVSVPVTVAVTARYREAVMKAGCPDEPPSQESIRIERRSDGGATDKYATAGTRDTQRQSFQRQ